MTADEFYTRLKSKVTGQVINGVLVGCLLESELKGAYEEYTHEQIRSKQRDSEDSE